MAEGSRRGAAYQQLERAQKYMEKNSRKFFNIVNKNISFPTEGSHPPQLRKGAKRPQVA